MSLAGFGASKDRPETTFRLIAFAGAGSV